MNVFMSVLRHCQTVHADHASAFDERIATSARFALRPGDLRERDAETISGDSNKPALSARLLEGTQFHVTCNIF